MRDPDWGHRGAKVQKVEVTPEVPNANDIKNLECPTYTKPSEAFQGVMQRGVPPESGGTQHAERGEHSTTMGL
jgi:hypothetical protein